MLSSRGEARGGDSGARRGGAHRDRDPRRLRCAARHSAAGSRPTRPRHRERSRRRPASVEIIVVDGGSRDATRELAAAAGARVLASERGRARQLAAGVARERGRRGAVPARRYASAARLGRGGARGARRRPRRRAAPSAFASTSGRSCSASSSGARACASALWRLPVRRSGAVRAAPRARGDRRRARRCRSWRISTSCSALKRARAPRAARRARGHLGAPLPRAAGRCARWLRHSLAAAAWTLGVDRARIAPGCGR